MSRIAIGLATLVWLGLSTRVARSEDLTLPQIVERAHAWRSNFATIQIKTHAWNRQDFIAYSPGVDPDAALGKTDFHEEDFDWADYGAFRYEMRVMKGGKWDFRTALANDGRRSWGADTKHGEDQDHWASIQLLKVEPGKALTSTVITPLYGIWANGQGVWFDERIADASATLIGNEDLDGRRCSVVKVRSAAKKMEFDYWLDEEYGFVPRQLRVQGPRASAAQEKPIGHYYTWHADEFELIDEVCWFPVRGTFVEVENPLPGFEWFVDDVILNDSLTPDAFAPPKPSPGSQVIDMVNSRGWTQAAKGGDKTESQPQSADRQTSLDAAEALASTGGDWKWLAGGFCIVLVVAVALWRRQRGGA